LIPRRGQGWVKNLIIKNLHGEYIGFTDVRRGFALSVLKTIFNLFAFHMLLIDVFGFLISF